MTALIRQLIDRDSNEEGYVIMKMHVLWWGWGWGWWCGGVGVGVVVWWGGVGVGVVVWWGGVGVGVSMSPGVLLDMSVRG